MKYLITTIATVVLVGCGPSVPDISIHQAAADRNLEIVKKHLINGVDINTKDEEGMTPLHKAVAKGNDEIVNYLIKNGAYLNIKDQRKGTPLHWAAFAGRMNTCELLLIKRMSVKPMNKNDLTPPDLTPAPNKIEKSESGDLNSGVTTIGGESLVEITKSGDLTLGVSAIPMWGERKVRTNPRKHGANTGEDLKARGN